MSDQLVSHVQPEPEPGAETDAVRPSRAATLRRVAWVVGAAALLGVLGGFVWEWLWTPPTGAAWKGEWQPDPDGMTKVVDGTAWFVVVGLVYGLVLGVVTVLVTKGHEIATTLSLFGGSVLAGWMTMKVGGWLGPDDADRLAQGMGDLEPLVLNLRLDPSQSPWWPEALGNVALLAPALGATTAALVMYLCTDERGSRRRRRRG